MPDIYFGMYPISHPRPTQPSIPPGLVNEYQLRLGRQRQVWFIPLADECRKLWDPLRTRAIPEHLRGVFTTRRYTNTRLPLLLPFLLLDPVMGFGMIRFPAGCCKRWLNQGFVVLARVGTFLCFFCVSGACVFLFLCFQLSVSVQLIACKGSSPKRPITCWVERETLLPQLTSLLLASYRVSPSETASNNLIALCTRISQLTTSPELNIFTFSISQTNQPFNL